MTSKRTKINRAGKNNGNYRHGCAHTKLFYIWARIKQRCRNRQCGDYKFYGARGIDICDAWFDSYIAFCKGIGKRPSEKHTLDRKNNDGNYEPGNVHWVLRKFQNSNSRRCRFFNFMGRTWTLTKLAQFVGIDRMTLTSRLKYMTLMEALTTPNRYAKCKTKTN